MKEYGFSHKLSEAWIAHNYFVQINGCDVREIDLLDFEAIYGGCSVNAILTIQDTQGFMNGTIPGMSSLAIGGFVRVGYEAAGGCGGKYDETFSIAKIRSDTNESNKRLLVLDLIDIDTINKQGTFVTKSYNNKKPTEIIKEHSEKTKAGVKQAEVRKTNIIPHLTENKQSLTIPSNISFFTFMQRFTNLNGMNWVKDKFSTYVVSKQTTDFDKLKTQSKQEEFEVDVTSEHSYWKILQYNLDGFNVGSVLDSIPQSKTSTLGTSNQEGESKDENMKSTIIDSKKTVQKGGAHGVNTSDSVFKKGNKQGTKHSPNLQQYYETLSNAQTCSIWVPGLNRNRIGFRVLVAFPRPSYLVSSEYDKTFTGDWEITAVRDKIIKQYFVQEIFLRRPGGA